MERLGIEHKDCSKCGEYKHFDDFHNQKTGLKTGITGFRSTCKECDKIAWEEYSLDNRKSLLDKQEHFRKNNRVRIRVINCESRQRHRITVLLRAARTRARKKGLPFDLFEHEAILRDRLNVGRCEMTGIEFNFASTGAKGRRNFNAPSIDRIKSNEGYLFKNVRLICWGMNVALADWGEEELRARMSVWLAHR
jgi:hypothetical protein